VRENLCKSAKSAVKNWPTDGTDGTDSHCFINFLLRGNICANLLNHGKKNWPTDADITVSHALVV
jgi:hypothetical protein